MNPSSSSCSCLRTSRIGSKGSTEKLLQIEKLVVKYTKQKHWETYVSVRIQSPVPAATAPGGQGKGKNLKQACDRFQWVSRGRCSRRAKCGCKHDLGKRQKIPGRRPEVRRNPAHLAVASMGKGTPKGTRLGGKQNQPVQSKSQERRRYQGKGPRSLASV